MAIEGCPRANQGCPLWDRPTPKPLEGTQTHGCFSDLDHAVPQRLAKRRGATQLERAYIYSEANQRQLCRQEHLEKTALGDEPIPPVHVMIQALRALRRNHEEAA